MFQFMSEHSIFVVLAIVLLIWFGIFVYLFSIDKKLTRLENITNEITGKNSSKD